MKFIEMSGIFSQVGKRLKVGKSLSWKFQIKTKNKKEKEKNKRRKNFKREGTRYKVQVQEAELGAAAR